MPIYDFKCSTCNHTYEVVCKIDERNDTKVCPKCGEDSRMVITSNDTGFILKGDHWANGEARRKYGDHTEY